MSTHSTDSSPSTNSDRVLISENGVLLTKALFLETYDKRGNYRPLYTLSDREKHGYPSAYQIYMAAADEYDAAEKLVGSWRHWRKLLRCGWFMKGGDQWEGLEQWREDMAARDMSVAKSAILKAARSGDSAAANRLAQLAEPHLARPVGRPPTKETKAQAEARKKEEARQEALASLRKELKDE